MKKLILIFFIFNLVSLPILAEENSKELYLDETLKSKIMNIGFVRHIKKDDITIIKNTIMDVAKYSSKKNSVKLKKLYSSKFVSEDGFDYNTYFDMAQKTWDIYSDLGFQIIIKDITINGNYAIVSCVENFNGETKETIKNIKDKGALKSTSKTIYYLEKIGSEWLITSYNAIDEYTTLKYGSAKMFDFKLIAPSIVKTDQDYTISLETMTQSNDIVLASLTNEPIVYPPVTPEEIFKKADVQVPLERVVRSNKAGYNENAIASIGITSKLLGKDKESVKVGLSGIAFVISRVNVILDRKYELEGN